MIEIINTFYGTFGEDHIRDGVKMAGYYIQILASSFDEALEKMNRRYGNEWNMVYVEGEFTHSLCHNGMFEKLN